MSFDVGNRILPFFIPLETEPMNRLPSLMLVCFSAYVCAQAFTPSKEVDSIYPSVHPLYFGIHEHPELSGHETQTAAKLAAPNFAVSLRCR